MSKNDSFLAVLATTDIYSDSKALQRVIWI